MTVATQQNRVTFDFSNMPEVVNDSFYHLLFDESRWILEEGGRGSGKSEFTCLKFLWRAISESGHRFLFIRKVARTCRHSVYDLTRDVVYRNGWESFFTFNKSDLTITAANGSRIYCLGLDDPEKLKSIAGVSGVWIEEATECTERDVRDCNLLMRGGTPGYKQNVLTYNPIHVRHWIKTKFIPSRPASMTRHHSTYKDNRWLDEEYKRELEELASHSKNLHRVYALGLWGMLEGLVYDLPEEIEASAWPAPDWFDETIYGLDFGFNNPTALIEVNIKDREPWERELLYETGLTNADLIGRMGALIPNKRSPIYCDNSEPARIEELRRAGFNVHPARKGKDSVRSGIDFCKAQKTRVHADSRNLINEYASYSWATDKNGQSIDVPFKENDHLMDGGRYAKVTHLWRPKRTASLAGFGIFAR